jgi:hypothetical protein
MKRSTLIISALCYHSSGVTGKRTPPLPTVASLPMEIRALDPRNKNEATFGLRPLLLYSPTLLTGTQAIQRVE